MNTNCARNLHATETEHGKREMLLLLRADKKLGEKEIKAKIFLLLFFFKLTRFVCPVQLTAQNLRKTSDRHLKSVGASESPD